MLYTFQLIDERKFGNASDEIMTLGNPTDCSPSGSSVHGILQATILEWAAMPSSKESSPPMSSSIGRQILYHLSHQGSLYIKPSYFAVHLKLRRSAFFTVQLSHPYMTTGKTVALLDGP